MAGMLQEKIQNELDNQITERYPHLKNPSVVWAKVTKSENDGAGNYTLSLKILDKIMNENNDYPEIPLVKTKVQLEENDTAVVVLLYGEANPYILGRWES